MPVASQEGCQWQSNDPVANESAQDSRPLEIRTAQGTIEGHQLRIAGYTQDQTKGAILQELLDLQILCEHLSEVVLQGFIAQCYEQRRHQAEKPRGVQQRSNPMIFLSSQEVSHQGANCRASAGP